VAVHSYRVANRKLAARGAKRERQAGHRALAGSTTLSRTGLYVRQTSEPADDDFDYLHPPPAMMCWQAAPVVHEAEPPPAAEEAAAAAAEDYDSDDEGIVSSALVDGIQTFTGFGCDYRPSILQRPAPGRASQVPHDAHRWHLLARTASIAFITAMR
jgi:hypothetical protein